MDGKELISLQEMKNGEHGIVEEIIGGQTVIQKLSDIGIRIGKEIIKVCKQPLGGPVQAKIGRVQVALGHNMSSKIIVYVIQKDSCSIS